MASERVLRGGVALLLLALVGCEAPPPVAATPTPARGPTPLATPTRALAIAVAVGSPTPTVQVSGDFASVVRPPVLAIKAGLGQLEAQLAAAQKTPMLMAQDDWRNQTQAVLQDLLGDSAQLRTASARAPSASPLKTEVTKVGDDVDFVANEFRMALDYDPDATHLIRAARAEKTTSAEVDALVAELH